MKMNLKVTESLDKVYSILGGKGALAKVLGISYQSIDKWHDKNEMPCTEYNGKTDYSRQIQELTDGEVTIKDLCGFVPPPQA